ncbi:hypothetical protein [Nocardia carnea]|uniref:hypothetical protein n=1 Tax=Nocardia carnea TaxID=37328 RepID=UPI0032AE9CD3
MHQIHLLGVGFPFCHRLQYCPAQPQTSDLDIEGGRVRSGDLRPRSLAGQDAPHSGQVYIEFAQCADQFQAGQGSNVVEPVGVYGDGGTSPLSE